MSFISFFIERIYQSLIELIVYSSIYYFVNFTTKIETFEKLDFLTILNNLTTTILKILIRKQKEIAALKIKKRKYINIHNFNEIQFKTKEKSRFT